MGRRSFIKNICAFANDLDNWGGGYIVIGVKNKGNGEPDKLIGVDPEKIDGYLKDMLNKCKLIQPEYMPITEVVDYQEKKYSKLSERSGNFFIRSF